MNGTIYIRQKMSQVRFRAAKGRRKSGKEEAILTPASQLFARSARDSKFSGWQATAGDDQVLPTSRLARTRELFLVEKSFLLHVTTFFASCQRLLPGHYCRIHHLCLRRWVGDQRNLLVALYDIRGCSVQPTGGIQSQTSRRRRWDRLPLLPHFSGEVSLCRTAVDRHLHDVSLAALDRCAGA